MRKLQGTNCPGREMMLPTMSPLLLCNTPWAEKLRAAMRIFESGPWWDDAHMKLESYVCIETHGMEVNLVSRLRIISVPWGLKLFAHISKNGNNTCFHKIVLLLLHKKHKHGARSVFGVDKPSCLSASISVQMKPVQHLIESVLSAQMGLPGQDRAASLTGCHSVSVMWSLTISQTECALTKKRNELRRSHIICK